MIIPMRLFLTLESCPRLLDIKSHILDGTIYGKVIDFDNYIDEKDSWFVSCVIRPMRHMSTNSHLTIGLVAEEAIRLGF